MPMTIGELLVESRHALRRAAIASASLDAELICCHAYGWDRARLWAHPEARVSPEGLERCRAMVKRRAQREPLAYILGVKEFWSLEFRVAPAVFIPRPETETLVEAVLDHLEMGTTGIVLEVGTGSGCVAVALAIERPGLRVVTTDISVAALGMARENIVRHGMGDRVSCLACNLAQAIAPNQPLLGVVSNPPYVARGLYDEVDEEIRYEPPEALDGGPSGLELVRGVIEQAAVRLRPGAFLALEVGPEQVVDVGVLLAEGPWDHIESVEDLQGVPRVVVADRIEE
ncbi:MAG: peptide chain release factor N(5)-glutamine methyltransferase [Candidatus Tectimicrobiota bacterium]